MGKIFLTFSRAFPWKLFMKIAGLLTNQFWRPQSPISCVDFFWGGGYNKHTAWLTSLVIIIKCAHLVKRLLFAYRHKCDQSFKREKDKKKRQWNCLCKVWTTPKQLVWTECGKIFIGMASLRVTNWSNKGRKLWRNHSRDPSSGTETQHMDFV